MTRPLKPCGTIAAYARHKRDNEPIDDACQQAWRNYKNGALPVAVKVTLPRLDTAACATPFGMRLFANITADTEDKAREICRSCPVQRTCLQWGVLYEDEGMWGGLTRDELRRERHHHGIQRQEPWTSWRAPSPTTRRQELAA